nr:hypothetical protein [Tanacetum cinerariifolium]
MDLEEPFNDVYVTPAHTKKVFTNMKRQNKDFCGTVTPLFATVLVPPLVEGKGSRQPSEPQPPSSTDPLEQDLADVSQPQKTQTPRRTKRGEDDRVVRAATTTASLEAEQESDCSTLGDQKVSKESQKIGKEAKGKNSRDEALQDWETKVFYYTTAAKKDVNAAEPVSTVGDTVNVASVIPNVSVVGPSISAASPSISTAEDIFEDEMPTMTDTLMDIRRTRPKTTSIVIHDVEEEPRRATPPPTVQSQDKVYLKKNKHSLRESKDCQGKVVEQEAKDAALIEQMKDVQARIDADALLAERLQKEEREQFTIDEQARMLIDLIAERKREHKWINDFVPMDSEKVNDSKQQVESSKKRSRADHDKESVKKKKLGEDNAEKEELRACLDIETLSALEEVFEALKTTGLSKAHIASMWSVKGDEIRNTLKIFFVSVLWVKKSNLIVCVEDDVFEVEANLFSSNEWLFLLWEEGKDTKGLEGLDLEEDSP